jgi:hypothetical protein
MIKKSFGIILALVLLVSTMSTLLTADAAGSLSALSDTMSNQTISANSAHRFLFTTPTGVTASSQTIVVTFPTGFNFSSKSISTLRLSYGITGTQTTAIIASTPGTSTQWGAVFSGSNNVILTLTAPTSGTYIAPGDQVILDYDYTDATAPVNSTNPSVASNPPTTVYAVTLNVNGDTGTITVPILTNSQVAITATVAQSLSFALSSNAIDFGTLSSSSTKYATTNAASGGSGTEPTNAHTLSAGTNGASGYTVTVSGSTLTSGANNVDGISGGTAAVLAIGTEQFGIRSVASGGSGTVSAPFNGADSTHYGFGNATSINQSPFASASAATAVTTYNVNYAANVATLTPAGSYTTTLTYVATANF